MGCTSRVKSSVEGACGAAGPRAEAIAPASAKAPAAAATEIPSRNFSSSDSPLLTGIVIPIEAIQEIRAISPK